MTRRRALLVACADYGDPRLDRLRSPVHDVEVIAGLLGDPVIGGYDVRLLLDPTEHEVRLELARLLRLAARSDHLLLFFACHGRRDRDGQLYLAMTDTDVDDLPATALSTALVNLLLNRSPCQRVVLLLDCCFSGAVSRVLTHPGGDAVRGGELFPGEGTGRFVLTATTAYEYAWDGASGLSLSDGSRHSVFAHAVIQGLGTGDADRDGDGLVSADDLYRYVRDAVAAAGGQTPRRWVYGAGDLYIARSRRGTATALTKPPAPIPPSGVETAPSEPSRPKARAPWEADRLDWKAGVPEPVERALRGPHDGAAWVALRGGAWDEATARFQTAVRAGGSAGSWWGLGFSHAVAGRWGSAADCFGAAAGHDFAARTQPGLVPPAALRAGTLLLTAVTLRAGGDDRAAQVVAQSVDELPLCPPLLVLSAAWTGDESALVRAMLLDPEVAIDCAAAGMAVDPAVAVAADRAQVQLRRLEAAVTRLRTAVGEWLITTMSGASPSRLAEPGPVNHDSPLFRLRAARRGIDLCRDQLIELLHGCQIALRAALRTAIPDGGGALVADARNAIHAADEALRATDRPAPLPAAGIPPIRPVPTMSRF
jgi:hypothetical protein